jgi:hypothetical protein
VDWTDTQREADQEETSILKEAGTMAAQKCYLLNSMIKKKKTLGAIHQKGLSLKKRCMVATEVVVLTVVEAAKDSVVAVVDIETVEIEAMEVDTEIVVVTVTEEVIEGMEAVVASIVKVLKFLLLLKEVLLKCFLIISVLKQTHNLEIFTFIGLITVYLMTLKIQILVLELSNPFIHN